MDEKEGKLSKKYLLQALQAQGLPHTRVTVIDYEKRGIIDTPKTQMVFGNKTWNFYTQEEINECVAKVKAYREKL